MVTFKKDNDKKEKVKRELGTVVSLFTSGFIIATFLVLYVVLATVNYINSSNTSNNDEPPSGEGDGTSNSSEPLIDPYINEKAINSNLLTIVKDYNPNVSNITHVGYDETYLYVVGTSSSDIHIYKGELGSYTVNELLEALISSDEVFSVSTNEANYPLTNGVSPDITSLDTFTYKEYTYRDKYIYYYDDLLHEAVGLTSVGYKSNSYISIIDMTYNSNTSTLLEGHINIVSESNTEYYKLLDYYYHK